MRYRYKSIVVLVIISIFVSCKLEKSQQNENNKIISREKNVLSISEYKEIKEWKYGFGFYEEDGTLKPTCFDNNKWQFSRFHKTKNNIDSIKDGEIVKAAFLDFFDTISVCDAIKDYSNALGYVRDHNKHKYKNIKQKLIGNKNYVSEDGKLWEELKILYVKEVDGKNPFGDPLVIVYFKCSFFEGEYFLNSSP